MASCSDFGDGGDDFSSTSCCHHFGGQEPDWTVSTCLGGASLCQSSNSKQSSSGFQVCVLPVPAPPVSADTGMVLIMVVPGLVVVDPACAVLRRVVCLPSADVTNFKMVPAGRGPFV